MATASATIELTSTEIELLIGALRLLKASAIKTGNYQTWPLGNVREFEHVISKLTAAAFNTD